MATTDFERREDEGGHGGEAPTSRCATPMPSRIEIELDVEKETESEFAGVKEICRRAVRGWGERENPNETIEVSPVRGGITNALFKVARRDGGADADILLIYVNVLTGFFVDKFLLKIGRASCRERV